MRSLCTLHELRTLYTLSDLVDFHNAIAEWDEAKRRAQDKPT